MKDLNRTLLENQSNADIECSWLGDKPVTEELACADSSMCFVCERAVLRSSPAAANWKKQTQAAVLNSQNELFTGSSFTLEDLVKLKPPNAQPKESFYIFDTRLGRKRRHDPFFAKHAQAVGIVPKEQPTFVPPLNLKQKRVQAIPPAKQRKMKEQNSSTSVVPSSCLMEQQNDQQNVAMCNFPSIPSFKGYACSKSLNFDEEWAVEHLSRLILSRNI